MDGVIDNLGKTPENVHTDGAYGNEETMSYIDNKTIGNFLKYNSFYKESKKKWKEIDRLAGLEYNKEKDEFICPSGIKIKFEREREEINKRGYKRKIKRYKPEEGDCDKCNFHKSKNKSLNINWEYERLKNQAKSNLNSEKGIELRKKRGNEVESVFGDEKLNKLKRRYHLRGLKKVNVEAGLFYIAHNIRKINDNKKYFYENKQDNLKINNQKFTKPLNLYPL
jgi:hypothetical protein